MAEFSVKTEHQFELINIDDQVQQAVTGSRIRNGLIQVFVPHATCGLVLNEDEPNLKQDYLRVFRFISELGPFAHDQVDDNASAHLLASIFGQSLILPMQGGKLAKGTWQQIMLAEFDGPRTRKILVTFIKGT